MSTKIPVSRKRVLVHNPEKKRVSRDPRFDAVKGGVDPTVLSKEYSFVDESRAQELKNLQSLLKGTTDVEEREEIVERIQLLREQERILNQKRQAHELSTRVKAKRRALNEQAGRPVNLNRKKLKEIEMAERYEMLKEQGKVDKYLSRKRKKLQQKNKKSIPVTKKK